MDKFVILFLLFKNSHKAKPPQATAGTKNKYAINPPKSTDHILQKITSFQEVLHA